MKRYPTTTYFALTFLISWDGILLLIAGFGGLPTAKEQSYAQLPACRILTIWVSDKAEFLPITLLMHAVLTAGTMIFHPSEMRKLASKKPQINRSGALFCTKDMVFIKLV